MVCLVRPHLLLCLLGQERPLYRTQGEQTTRGGLLVCLPGYREEADEKVSRQNQRSHVGTARTGGRGVGHRSGSSREPLAGSIIGGQVHASWRFTTRFLRCRRRRSACSSSTAQRAEHPACPVALYQAPSASSAQASGLPFSPRRAPSAGNGVPLHAHLSPRGVWQNHPACPMACPERSACRLALARTGGQRSRPLSHLPDCRSANS